MKENLLLQKEAVEKLVANTESVGSERWRRPSRKKKDTLKAASGECKDRIKRSRIWIARREHFERVERV